MCAAVEVWLTIAPPCRRMCGSTARVIIERAVHVDAHEPLVVVEVHLDQRVEAHAGEERGVVDQVIEAAEGLHRCLGRRAGRLDRADIGRDEERASATCRDVGGDRLAARRIDVRDDDRRTLARERACVGFADAAG